MHTSPTHMVAGGSLFLGYALLREAMRHHQHTNMRPKIIDHLIATTLIGGISSVTFLDGTLGLLLTRGSIVGFTVGLGLWWVSLIGGAQGDHLKQSNIFYEDNVTDEEIAAF